MFSRTPRRPIVPLVLFACLLFLVGTGLAQAAQTLRLAVVTTPGTAQYVCADFFKSILEERSQGRFTVEIKHSGSEGSETDILNSVRFGNLELAIVTAGPLDTFQPHVRVIAYPFLFPDAATADRVLDGPVGREILAALEDSGFKGLAFSENGFRHLTNDVRPVRTPEDVQGLKIRVMESTLHKALWSALGASPTPMAWPIYAELKQGTIDAQENPLSIIALYKLFEVQKYLTLTGHVYSAHVDLANLGWFSSLDAADQELVATAMADAAKRQRVWSREREAAFLAELAKHGMEIVEDPDLAAFQAASAAVGGSGLYDVPKVADLLARAQAEAAR